MLKYSLSCKSCGSSVANGLFICPVCGGELEVTFNEAILRETFEKMGSSCAKGMWKYFDCLPLSSFENVVSLGEGETPLLKSKFFNRYYGMKNVYFKVESQNPTGSHKDRQASLGASLALENKGEACLAASCGNAGAAVAAYCARAGLKLFVLVSDDVSEAKLLQILMYGSHVLLMGANQDLYKIVNKVCANTGLIPLVTAHYNNPYLGEANKTIAYEISTQLNQCLPDYVFSPVGGGGLLAGVWKGFSELKKMEILENLPTTIAVQPEGCPSLYNAWKQNLKEIPAVEVKSSISGVNLAKPLDGELVLNAIRESSGKVVTVADDQVFDIIPKLGREEGLYLEPAGAVAIVGLINAVEMNLISKDATIVCLVTGAGWKSPLKGEENQFFKQITRIPVEIADNATYVSDLVLKFNREVN
jgi:threonine synthase